MGRPFYFAAAIIVLLTMAECARADKWVEFQLCRHETGELVDKFAYDGVKTGGMALLNVTEIKGLVKLPHDKCVLLVHGRRDTTSVAGSYRKVHCLIRGGPDCKDAMR